jgi:hypothetical protein
VDADVCAMYKGNYKAYEKEADKWAREFAKKK